MKMIVLDKRPNLFPRQIFISAIIIRVIMLLVVFSLKTTVSVFILTDDITMDKFANIYLSCANGPIDFSAFNLSLNGIGGQANYHTWFWLVAVLSYLFKSSIVVRVFNVILSALVPVIVYFLCLENGINTKNAEMASKMYAFMPYSVFFSCFIIKDILFTVLVLLFWVILIRIHKDDRWTVSRLLALLVLILLIRNMRGGVFEISLIVFVLSYIPKIYKEKKYYQLLFIFVIIAFVALLFGHSVNRVLTEKISYYSAYNRAEGTISIFRIDSITQIYKIPFSYLWSMLQPIMSPSTFQASVWLKVLSIANLSAIPVMLYNLIWLFRGNKDWFYWSTLILHLASIVLSLGTFRHYYYVIPFIYINSAMARNNSKRSDRMIIAGVSVLIALFVIIYTFIDE
jgi:hypothetical protein